MPLERKNIELTILMPCLNEEKTVALCVDEAKRFLSEHSISGEILVVDNGSTDNSAAEARLHGARVISVSERGYGNALRNGIASAFGKYVIMGDCDFSYDFYHIDNFLLNLRAGYSLVIGNRFSGGIEKGAMPFLHKIGVPFLSRLAALKFGTSVGDFHCGLRGVNREDFLSLNTQCGGMEFATEMIALFSVKKYEIAEIPIVLRKDLRGGKSHLRTFRDGFRHLKFILFGKIGYAKKN